jgi:hypothetical protein
MSTVERISPHMARVNDPEALLLPERCVVCDSPKIIWVDYTQYNAPIVLPFLAVTSGVTNVNLPYCSEHATRLRRRLFWLRASQVIPAVLFIATVFFLSSGYGPKLTDDHLWLLPVTLCPLLAWFLGSLWIIRPRVYDVTISFRLNCFYLRSKSTLFIDRVIEENLDYY